MSPYGSGEIQDYPVRRGGGFHHLPAFFHPNLYSMLGVFFDGTLSLLTHFVVNQPSFGIILLQVTTCGFWCGSFASAGPGPPVMNGIFEVCHWTWASFLANPAGGLYIIFPVPRMPSWCWIGVLKVFSLDSFFVSDFPFPVENFNFFLFQNLCLNFFSSYLLLEEPSLPVKDFSEVEIFKPAFSRWSFSFPLDFRRTCFGRTWKNLL